MSPISVVDAALALPAEERVDLVKRLVASLDETAPVDVSDEWLREIERRLAEYRAGKVSAIPAEDVMSAARKAVRR